MLEILSFFSWELEKLLQWLNVVTIKLLKNLKQKLNLNLSEKENCFKKCNYINHPDGLGVIDRIMQQQLKAVIGYWYLLLVKISQVLQTVRWKSWTKKKKITWGRTCNCIVHSDQWPCVYFNYWFVRRGEWQRKINAWVNSKKRNVRISNW